jgi:hypothetical protein
VLSYNVGLGIMSLIVALIILKFLQSFSLTSPRNGGRSVGIVRSRIQATEFVSVLFLSMKV